MDEPPCDFFLRLGVEALSVRAQVQNPEKAQRNPTTLGGTPTGRWEVVYNAIVCTRRVRSEAV